MKIKYYIILLIAFTLSSCKVGRFVVYNFADIKDYKKFPSREINKDENYTFNFFEAQNEPNNLKRIENDFENYLDENKTVAFLIIQNDSIKYEHYAEKFDEQSIVPSFSMAKSITSILIGCAIDDGLIKSVNEPVTNYIPELKKNGFEKVSIEHLLQMTSGLDYNESYTNPFGDAATFYYGLNLRKAISKMKLKSEPGIEKDYVSGNTQLLGLILERALKDKNISSYLEEKIWIPLGMEYNASWSIDRKKNGLEKTFCCVNARARDFAKIGRLYLNEGSWNGEQIVSKEWVVQSTKVDSANGSAKHYQYQWWLPNEEGDYMAQGILGQYIFVSPAKNLIIVRLGKKYGDVRWRDFFAKIKEQY